MFRPVNCTVWTWHYPYLHSEWVCVATSQVPAESRACRLCIAAFCTDSPFSNVLLWRAPAREEEAPVEADCSRGGAFLLSPLPCERAWLSEETQVSDTATQANGLVLSACQQMCRNKQWRGGLVFALSKFIKYSVIKTFIGTIWCSTC